VERQFLNQPREIVFDETPHILSRSADDSIFWGIQDLTLYWGRFIDDVLNFFQGCEKQAEWYFDKLNAFYPGQVHFTWECSNSKGIFLNIEIFKNENL
jgi:hypothetical protein